MTGRSFTRDASKQRKNEGRQFFPSVIPEITSYSGSIKEVQIFAKEPAKWVGPLTLTKPSFSQSIGPHKTRPSFILHFQTANESFCGRNQVVVMAGRLWSS